MKLIVKMLLQLREPCEINNVWAAQLTDYIETKMQEVSCGEALYGFWHVGETVFELSIVSKLSCLTDASIERSVMP